MAVAAAMRASGLAAAPGSGGGSGGGAGAGAGRKNMRLDPRRWVALAGLVFCAAALAVDTLVRPGAGVGGVTAGLGGGGPIAAAVGAGGGAPTHLSAGRGADAAATVAAAAAAAAAAVAARTAAVDAVAPAVAAEPATVAVQAAGVPAAPAVAAAINPAPAAAVVAGDPPPAIRAAPPAEVAAPPVAAVPAAPAAAAPVAAAAGAPAAPAGGSAPSVARPEDPLVVQTIDAAGGSAGGAGLDAATAPAAAPAAVAPAAAPAAAVGAPTSRHCDVAAAAGVPCVLDLGFNTGQDTHFYLADGYSVIGVDANPDLIAAGRTRFADATTKGMLTLVSNGLVGEVADGVKPPETLRFYRSKLRSEWSSFDASWGCRNPNNTPVEKEVPAHCEVIEVPVTTCAGLIQRFGKPLYMKIDIEGRDTACLNSLHTLPRASRPTFVSVENVNEAHIDLLSALGYTSQKAVDQRVIHARYMGQPDLLGNSGPFGDAAVHLSGKTEWVSAQEVRGLLPLPERHEPTGEGMWYDLHGRLEGDPAAEGGSKTPAAAAAVTSKAA
ncbi:hypothetical protein MMPV_004545 [Pyropia vietnamensis]